MTNPSNYKLVITAGVPEPVRVLLWDVFFSSRGRGVSLSVHFPWLDNDENVFCIGIPKPGATQAGKIIAALVIKRINVSTHRDIGLIGLVCVAEEWRGKGFSSRLMSEATNFGKKINLDALVLWTQKPNIYTGHDFVSDGQDMFGYAQRRKVKHFDIAFSSEAWPDSMSIKSQQGLPPFAKSGRLISAELASAVVLDAQDGGVTLAKWSGRNKDVADLLESSLPNKWGLNIYEGDGLVVELQKRDFEVDLKPAAVRMVKNLKNSPMPELKIIEFLDRV